MPRQIGQGLAGQGFVGHDHIKDLGRKVEQGLVVHLGSDEAPPFDEDLLAGGHHDHVIQLNKRGGLDFDDGGPAPNAQDETARFPGRRLQFPDGFVHHVLVGDPEGAHIEPARQGNNAKFGFTAAHLGFQFFALFREIHPEQLGPDRSQEPGRPRGAEEIGYGVSDRHVIDERGFLVGGNRELVDGIGGHAQHGGDRLGSGQQSGGRTGVVTEKPGHEEGR